MSRSSPLPVRVALAVAALLTLAVSMGPGGRFAGTAAADSTDVILNEITTWSPQTVEVRNTGPDSVDLDGFRLEGEAGLLFEFTSRVILPPDSVLAIPLPGPDTLRITGDAVGWLDGLVPIDDVPFGDHGGAPVPIRRTPFSLARAGGGPMDPDPALTWTVDPEGTLGGDNDVPLPDLAGGGVVMNEWSFPLAGPREIELFNNASQPVDVGSWMLTSDLNRVLLSALAPIPPGGFLVVNVDDIGMGGTHPNVYLLRDDGVKVSQIGLNDAPDDSTTIEQLRIQGLTLAAFPDGSGPHGGFNLPSSGGDETSNHQTRYANPPSLGMPNPPPSTSAEPATWGRVKARFRR